jgi:hypothetical protein
VGHEGWVEDSRRLKAVPGSSVRLGFGRLVVENVSFCRRNFIFGIFSYRVQKSNPRRFQLNAKGYRDFSFLDSNTVAVTGI